MAGSSQLSFHSLSHDYCSTRICKKFHVHDLRIQCTRDIFDSSSFYFFSFIFLLFAFFPVLCGHVEVLLTFVRIDSFLPFFVFFILFFLILLRISPVVSAHIRAQENKVAAVRHKICPDLKASVLFFYPVFSNNN